MFDYYLKKTQVHYSRWKQKASSFEIDFVVVIEMTQKTIRFTFIPCAYMLKYLFFWRLENFAFLFL
jgi:hypothetical protein